MANITYSAGIATAYGAAVRGGYTGTYEDFCRQQAQYAESAAAVEQAKADAETAADAAEASKTAAAGSASAAATSAGQASTSATNAANSATEANASKNAAATSAGNAENSATAAAGSASAAAESAEEAEASAEAAAQSAASVDVHVDGTYPDMTAGNAEQLVSAQYVTDKTPYLYRTTGGSSDVGNREYVRGIVGGTVAWNQLVRYRTGSSSGITVTADGDHINISGTGQSNGTYLCQGGETAIGTAGGHKNLILMDKTMNASEMGVRLQYVKPKAGGGYDYNVKNVYSSTINATPAEYTNIGPWIWVASGYEVPSGYSLKFNIFDLTQMFGTTIADYIYGLEQANAGAGVAWFRKLFPNDYYPYNAGELKSVEGVSSHEMVGFNQWDEEWELGTINQNTGATASDNTRIRSKNFIPVFPNTAYYITSTTDGRLTMYDADKAYVGFIGSAFNSHNFSTPSDCHYIKISPSAAYGTTYNHDICINLSWSGTRNGEYKPYEKHTYALDSSLTLRGIPKLDNGSLYYDGDVYAPDGTVTRRYGIVDMGTLNWEYIENRDYFRSNSIVSTAKASSLNATPNAECTKYVATSWNALVSGLDKHFTVDNESFVQVKDSAYGTDAASFKAAMSGVYLLYELATPTTESADPYNETQVCDDFGTEEYVSTSIVPVGHTTDYPANLRDKLQHLPDLASADGNYIVSQSGTQMTLAPLPIVIPAPPTTDGTYTFRATVSNGVPTLSWVSE